jgi:SAM-dependent methyltransferase
MLEAVSQRDADRAACPACGGALGSWRVVGASEPSLDAQRYALSRCGRCGTAVTLGPPEPGLHDGGAFRAGQPRLHRVARPALRAFDAQRLRLLGELTPAGAERSVTVLDAGAGQGRFVALARTAGYDAFGIEPAQRGVERAAEIGAPVLSASIETAPVEPSSLDAIVLWHVLEHLPDPQDAVARIHGWLRPGGGLLIGAPNLASLQARLGGPRWYHLDVPRHRTHFTPAGLAHLLRGSGFEVTGIRHLLLEHNAYGMWQSGISRLTRHPSYLYNLLKRNAPVDARDLALTVVAVPLAPVAALAELLAGLAGRGGTVAVLARRV